MDEQMVVAALAEMRQSINELTRETANLSGQFNEFKRACATKHSDGEKMVNAAVSASVKDRADLFKRIAGLEQAKAVVDGRRDVEKETTESHRGWMGWAVALLIAAIEYFKVK